jgi:hypothetical protein
MYLDSSNAQLKRDTAAMNVELSKIGKTQMTRAPYSKGFEVDKHMTPAWFATDSARTNGREHSELPGAEWRLVEAR